MKWKEPNRHFQRWPTAHENCPASQRVKKMQIKVTVTLDLRPHENKNYHKDQRTELAGMWRKENPYSLLMQFKSLYGPFLKI